MDGDRPSAAEQRHRIGLVGKAQRIGGEVVAIQPQELERILYVLDAASDDLMRPLRNEAGIRAEEEIDERCSAAGG